MRTKVKEDIVADYYSSHKEILSTKKSSFNSNPTKGCIEMSNEEEHIKELEISTFSKPILREMGVKAIFLYLGQ
jgi:hypothetical protein